MTPTLDDLIARLETAMGPSRELDALIHRHVVMDDEGVVGGLCAEGWVCGVGENPTRSPLYTASLDAALTLVPKGCDVNLRIGYAGDYVGASVVHSIPGKVVIGTTRGKCERLDGHAALALCIAALRARRTA